MTYLEEFSHLLNLDQEPITQSEIMLKKFPEVEEHICVPAVVYLACQMSQVALLNGTTLQGNGITLTQIIGHLESEVNVESFLSFLQELPMKLEYNSIDFEQIVTQANISFRLYKKFDKCFGLLKKSENPEASPYFAGIDVYLQELKKVVWLFYLITRNQIIKYEEQNPYMLSSADLRVSLILVGSLEIIFKYLQGYEVPTVQEMMKEGFNQTDLQEELEYYSPLCEEYIKQLIADILHQKTDTKLIFDQIHLQHTYKGLYQIYQNINNCGNNNLDELCFLRQKIVFTPKKQNINQYEIIQKKVKMDPPFMQTPLKSNKFSNQSTEKHYFDIGKIEPQTPFTKMNDKYQWSKKIGNEQIIYLYDSFQQISDEHYEQVRQQNKLIIKLYGQLANLQIDSSLENSILTLNDVVLDGLIREDFEGFDIRLLSNQKFLNSILALSIFTQLNLNSKYVNNKFLMNSCDIKPTDLWRVISNFARCSIKIPQSISKELFELEKQILLNYLWHYEIDYLINLFQQCNFIFYLDNLNQENLKFFEIQLIKRIQIHIDLRVTELSEVLRIPIKDQIHTMINQFFTKPDKDVLYEQQMDTIILCSFYIYQKFRKLNPTFTQLKQLYTNYAPHNKQAFNRIVEYYNEKFVEIFRPIVRNLTDLQTINLPKNLITQSPLASKAYDRRLYALGETLESPQIKNQLISSIYKDIKPF